jgi:hypothetical protein
MDMKANVSVSMKCKVQPDYQAGIHEEHLAKYKQGMWRPNVQEIRYKMRGDSENPKM